MADESKGAVAGGVAVGGWDEEREDRWPIPYSAMLITVVSILLWALIIAGVRWLIA